jgi:hypothetical protein
MGGAVLQLVSYGKQSEYIIGNPNVSYFKYVHKRHTNFSKESISNNFSETLDFGKKSSCTIGKHGDLISKMLLQISLPKIDNSKSDGKSISWTNELGHSIINKVEFLIGGIVIDTIDGDWLNIYSEFHIDASKKEGYFEMIKYMESFDNYSFKDKMNLYIPLPFWFTQNLGSSLPLVALQYHDIVVNVYLRPISECFFSGNDLSINIDSKIINSRIFCDYIFLDTKERKQFAINEHEYLIIQHQKNDNNSIRYGNKSINIPLEFNHPTKALYWILQNKEAHKMNLWGEYNLNIQRVITENPIEILDMIEMKINGQDRFSEREAEHFRLIEPFNFGTVMPKKFIYNYNFGLNNNYQPSGTINFSNIDNSNMIFKFNMESNVDHDNHIDIKIFAINYNILKIKNGMGGVMFSD